MQTVVDRWEGSLCATGGAIVPHKSFWYLIDFHWTNDKWDYRSISELPGNLLIKDLNQHRHILNRLEPHEAEETLGVYLSMNGDETKQVEILREKAQQFADNIRTS